MNKYPFIGFFTFLVIFFAMGCTKPKFRQVPINKSHLVNMDNLAGNKLFHNNEGDTLLAAFFRDSVFIPTGTSVQGMEISVERISHRWRIQSLRLELGAVMEANANHLGIVENDIFRLSITDEAVVAVNLGLRNDTISCLENCALIPSLDIFGTTYTNVITAAGFVLPKLYYNFSSGIFAFETLDGQIFQIVN